MKKKGAVLWEKLSESFVSQRKKILGDLIKIILKRRVSVIKTTRCMRINRGENRSLK